AGRLSGAGRCRTLETYAVPQRPARSIPAAHRSHRDRSHGVGAHCAGHHPDAPRPFAHRCRRVRDGAGGRFPWCGVSGASPVATGWHVTAEALFVRLSSLAILTLLSSFLARELMRQMEDHSAARERSERWASLLAAVAAAVRSMTLDPDRVLEVAVDTALAFG